MRRRGRRAGRARSRRVDGGACVPLALPVHHFSYIHFITGKASGTPKQSVSPLPALSSMPYHSGMTNRDVAAAFDEIADLLEFQNANPFRVRAYRNAARKIGDLSEPVAAIVADPEREVNELEGIGADLAEKITTFVNSGKLPMLEQLRAEIPAGVLALLRIPGLGPKKAAVLYKDLHITSLDMLREACAADKVQ